MERPYRVQSFYKTGSLMIGGEMEGEGRDVKIEHTDHVTRN